MNKKKLVKVLALVIGLFILNACSVQSNVESEQTEVDYAEEESIEKAEENEIEENGVEENEEVIGNENETAERMTPRESLEYLFDYLYPDKSNMAEIVLNDTEDELSYTFYFMDVCVETNETEFSNPWTLYLWSSTEDGLYYHFALYEEIWDTIKGEDGDYKIFSHSSYSNMWYVNAETQEIIPRKLFNEEAEEDEVYLIFNEKYSEISEKYSTYEGD